MRDTADPDVQDAPPAAPHPEVDRPAGQPAEPNPEPVAQDDAPQPARIVPGPLIAMSAETVAAAGAALWSVGGWTAVGLGAGALAGVGAAAVAGRRRSGWRTRSWSASSGWRSMSPPKSFGRTAGRGSSGRRARSGMPSLGEAGRAGARRGAGASPGRGTRTASRSAGFPGAGKRAGGRHATPGGRALHGVGNTARAARRAGAGALDRAAASALRWRAASRAARQALRGGGGPRAASRAARAAPGVATPGAWRRLRGTAWWGLVGWGLGLLYGAGRLLARAVQHVFHLHPAPAGANGDNSATPKQRINTTVDRPTSARATDTKGATDMAEGGAPGFVAAAEELADALKAYDPPPGAGGMIQMYSDMGMLPDALEHVALGFASFAAHCRDDLPLHAAIAEFVEELATIQAHMASVSAEIRPAIERLHVEDLARHRAPRRGEKRWNVA